MPPRGGSRQWRRTVAQVVRRDRGTCWLCGRPGADSADHILPARDGGTNHPANLRAVHHDRHPAPGVSCNRIRGTKPPDEARRLIAQRIAAIEHAPAEWGW